MEDAHFQLDSIDLRVLRALQHNGRATYDELAAAVGLSPSATLRRVRRLEEGGVIDHYAALLRPERVGLGLTAYLNVRLEKLTATHKRNPMDSFRAAVQTWLQLQVAAASCAAAIGVPAAAWAVAGPEREHLSHYIAEALTPLKTGLSAIIR